ncbi:DgyrCDS6007 [Dimorphilus gyrociliatus]|uniref:Dynein light intermediate chain n=1 Tax=Dimorphilus gyrociliatus TaxID=2664684 RepID=A0A7I8VLR4_9ANNE|nr:DgyrCDS6007 [Dimorphilus gyrociliatus]
MAPKGKVVDREGGLDGVCEAEDGEDLWSSILSGSEETAPKKKQKCLLLLGDNETGKTTLVTKLQGKDDPKKGAGLEYHYIDVKDEYRDDHSKLGVYLVDGDSDYISLLKFAMNEDTFEHCLILLVASMAAPWNLLDSLQKWTEVLQQHINRLKVPPEKMHEYEESMVTHFREYVEPDENQSSSSRRTFENPLHPSPSDENKVLLPLGESTLVNNLGVPIIVVLTKSDSISTLEKEQDYREEHFDFIQQHIRKFCLRFGAALFYVSVKENRNLDLLYRYIVHRIYGFPFSMPALVVERDAVFIPSGWDNEKKISILYENMTSMQPSDNFEDVIAKPIVRKPTQRENEVAAEDEQTFLMRQQTQITKPATPGREAPIRSGLKNSPASRQSPSSSAGPKKDALKGAQPDTGNGVLASFFNSLLSKNPSQQRSGSVTKGSTSSPVSSTPEAPRTSDAAAELSRLSRTPVKPPSSNSST